MTITEYVQNIIDENQNGTVSENVQEDSAIETAQLLSGSFIYPLYGALWTEFYEMDSICTQLCKLYWSDNHYGFVYFIALLANAVDFDIPPIFSQMSANDKLISTLSSAVLEDWLEYHEAIELDTIN
jgi:hypothetical protein